jgi:response regulator RpfG family c-di-GMP phosphodiesterase
VAETISCLARAVQLRSGEDAAHASRVGAACLLIARRLGLGEERASRIALASQLHDVGKLALPDGLLRKPGPLSAAERQRVEEHPGLGFQILAPASSELLRLAALIALTHHERFDGSGYPRRLAGEAIPVEGRIAAVADVFDALTSQRPYRPALSQAQAAAYVRREAGRGFDSRVVAAFTACLEDICALRRAD